MKQYAKTHRGPLPLHVWFCQLVLHSSVAWQQLLQSLPGRWATQWDRGLGKLAKICKNVSHFRNHCGEESKVVSIPDPYKRCSVLRNAETPNFVFLTDENFLIKFSVGPSLPINAISGPMTTQTSSILKSILHIYKCYLKYLFTILKPDFHIFSQRSIGNTRIANPTQ